MQIYMLQTLQLIAQTDQTLANDLSNRVMPIQYGDNKVYFKVKENRDGME